MSFYRYPVLWERKPAPRFVRWSVRLCFLAFIIGAIVLSLRSSLTAIERNYQGHAHPARNHGIRPVPSPSRDR